MQTHPNRSVLAWQTLKLVFSGQDDLISSRAYELFQSLFRRSPSSPCIPYRILRDACLALPAEFSADLGETRRRVLTGK
ncbi:hypothetical protein AFLA_007225 [Aspergillus flavus NRRL3357]|nr:hypothetical protein AFLA_007225 [Aspergillus flavus NRRL3357]